VSLPYCANVPSLFQDFQEDQQPVRHAVEASDLPLVKMDFALLDQALSVLLENVAVHTPSGTPIAIKCSIRDAAFYLAV
jgi:K+-sensing histidine kinase KdpD